MIVATLALAGCRDAHDENGHDHDHGHNHDHDHDHAEHVDPAHRPADFPEAVARLLAGHEAAAAALAAGRNDAAHDEHLPILSDLARWLPEIAADSDLPEAAWNRVAQAASTLQSVYESVHTTLDADGPVPPERLAQARAPLLELQGVLKGADPAWFEPIPPVGDGPREAVSASVQVAPETSSPVIP
jgi:hypothetical protein